MPYLSKLATIAGSSVIINKATLIAPIDETSNYLGYRPVRDLSLIELNPDNTFKYRNNQLAIVYGSAPTQGVYYPSTSSATDIATTEYSFDITRYVQFLLNGRYANDGFIITPAYYNQYYTNRTVLNSVHASSRKMRIEIYYTKVN